MKYNSFTIQNYRAIKEPLIVDINKQTLVPIIGVNECGKTTILQAIFSFDHFNDDLNKGDQLKNTLNLYKTSSKIKPTITAEIEASWDELNNILSYFIQEENESNENEVDNKKIIAESYIKLKDKYLGKICISRNLENELYSYSIEDKIFNDKKFNNLFAQEIVRNLPYILYFDDFRDSIPEKIEIKKEEGKIKGWLSIIEQIFKKTDDNYSVFELTNINDNQRKSIISDVTKCLNNTLTKKWAEFHLDESDALTISLNYLSNNSENEKAEYIEFNVIEKIKENGVTKERYYVAK